MQQDTTAADDGRTDLMNTLEELAGEGRVPVTELTVGDPRLWIETPAGRIHTTRRPDYVKREGTALTRAWYFGPYRLEEDKDGQPGLETNHAIVVTKQEGSDE